MTWLELSRGSRRGSSNRRFNPPRRRRRQCVNGYESLGRRMSRTHLKWMWRSCLNTGATLLEAFFLTPAISGWERENSPPSLLKCMRLDSRLGRRVQSAKLATLALVLLSMTLAMGCKSNTHADLQKAFRAGEAQGEILAEAKRNGISFTGQVLVPIVPW